MITNKRNIPKWEILKKSYKSNNNNLELAKLITIPFVLFVCVALAALSAQAKVYADEIPTRESIQQILSDKGENSKIYDRTGKLLFTFKDPVQDREYAEFSEIPPEIIAAVLAAEDEDFFIHHGIDYLGAAKGVATTLSSNGENTVGGSTITQQLIKQTLLTADRTIDRKAKEAILALMVEQAYTKTQILEYYLNSTSYGGRVIGIKTAARTYFNKSLEELTLNEAAFLVSLVQSPGEYSPLFSKDKERAIELSTQRRRFVLNQILENEAILEYLKTGKLESLGRQQDYGPSQDTNLPLNADYSGEFIEELKDQEVEFAPTEDEILAPHFVFYVRDILQEEPYNLTIDDLYTGGYKIHTSIDLGIQEIAERKVKEGVDIYGPGYGFENGALVTIDAQSGEILAMVGSKGYELTNDRNNKRFDPEVNSATSLHQLGSSLKPWVAYLAFDKKGEKYRRYTTVFDTPKTFQTDQGPYSPKNSDGKFRGEMSLNEAILTSRNLPFLKIADDLGAWQLPVFMQQIGYRKDTHYGLSAAVGGVDESLLDHTTAYTGLANGGSVKKSIAVLKIVDQSDTTIYTAQKGEQQFGLNGIAVSTVNAMLGDRRYSYGAYSLKFFDGMKLAGKTGTSENNRDTFYMGYGPKLVTGVWLGNNDNTPMVGNAYGINTALPVWSGYMREVMQKYPQYREYGSY